jgi:hypothetical protein
VENKDPDKDLKEMIAYLADTDDPETIANYYATFKEIEKQKFRWFLNRLDFLQKRNHELELELLKLKFTPWYKRIFYRLNSKN